MGNHCRAPLAAAVLAELGGDAVEVRSAGIRDWHVGEPAHPVMVRVAAAGGYDLTGHRGTLVTPQLLRWADAVLAMDATVLAALREISDEATAPKLALYLEDRDVLDPWKQPDVVFAACVSVVERGARRHLVGPPPGWGGGLGGGVRGWGGRCSGWL
jgi:protein-tyrosine phosphatase